MNIRSTTAGVALLSILALISAAASPVCAENATSSRVQASTAPLLWQDIDGHTFGARDAAQSRASVFVFASTQCPVSNIYMPRVKELARTFGDHGVRFSLVDPNPEDSAAVLRRYAKERGLTLPIVRDARFALADWLGVSRTPEAVVVDPGGDIRYRGRIDDSQDRAKVVHNDLRDAIDAILDGKPIAHPRTIAFGCAIFRDTGTSAPAKAAHAGVTFTRDVAPILNRNCVVCHRTGESAPFALQTYQQARTWSSAIKEYTSHRIMPPWKATESDAFHDARRLTDAEIGCISHWADSGAPEGNPRDLPPPPKFPEAGAWSLGKPDMVIEPPRAYHLSAEGPDVYRNFVLPVDFAEDRYISAMEFQPGNRAVVHHIVLYVDVDSVSAKMDGKDSEPGYTVPGTGIGILNAEWGEVWVPGRTPRLLPKGVAVKIPKGAKLVMQVHYHKNGLAQTDTSKVALYFARGSVKQLMRTVPLVNPMIAIQPGGTAQELKMSFNLPVAAHLHTIFPHMHLLGRIMRVTATMPDGDKKTIPLITINDWDFNWQETYAYREPVALPKGARIEMEAVYDNSDSNPRQMNHPPQVVRWGEQTTDEMCVCVLGFTVDREQLAIDAGAPRGGI